MKAGIVPVQGRQGVQKADQAFPFVFFAALIAYATIYMMLRKKRPKPHALTIFAEFVLVGWFAMFIYVTQIYSFGNGMGDLYNLKPLRMFYIAFRYGSNNAGMVWQFLLNILMFVPLGLLLPVVFPRKCRTWPRIALISFCATAATELLQLISRRGTDIDDVIANTVGGLCGFILFLVLYGIICLVKHKKASVPHFTRKLVVGICTICTVAAVFVAVKLSDGSSEYGSLYYGNMRPTNVTISESISQQKSVRAVYQYTEHTTLSDLQSKLIESSGFDGNFTENDDLYTLADGGDKRIFIYPYNTWCVTYDYGVDSVAALSDIPGEDAALDIAGEYLRTYGITSEAVAYSGDISDTYGDDNRHLQFVSTESTDKVFVYGTVSVTIGENGQLLEISDGRRWCEFTENVNCISPYDSIEIAQEVGVGEWNGTAVVTDVNEGYSFIDDTGYLIPTWNIVADMQTASGKQYTWSPVVDAIQ